MLAKSSVSTASPTAPFYARQSASFRSARPLPVRQLPDRAARFEAAASHFGRIEYHFHTSAQVHLDDPASERSLPEAAQGRVRARLSDLTVALRLFDGDRRLLGSLSTGREEAAYPAPVTQRHRPPLAARLLRGGALLCFDRGGRRLELVTGLVPSQGASMVAGWRAARAIALTVLTRLVRLGRFTSPGHSSDPSDPPVRIPDLPAGQNPDVSASLPDLDRAWSCRSSWL
jgi:hypothetical protein